MDKAPRTEDSTRAEAISGSQGRSQPRWRLLALAVIVVLVVLGVASLAFRPESPSRVVDAGTPSAAPLFVLDNLQPDQPDVSLAKYRGKPVVLNFFASWCAPCRREMPAFERVHRRFEGQVEFVGVDHQDQRNPALQLVRETGVSYPAGFDPEGKVAQAYGLFGMPSTVFISPDGHVLERHTGELSESKLSEMIRQHLLPGADSTAARP